MIRRLIVTLALAAAGAALVSAQVKFSDAVRGFIKVDAPVVALGESFIRLYLAGGVTTMRTGGNVNGFMDMKLKRSIDAGQKAGPAIDATAPYLNGANTFSQMRDLKGPDDVRRQVAYWADEGATSFKPICRSAARSCARRSTRSTSAA